MRTLFELDSKDYNPDGKIFSRPSVRAIIIKDGKLALVQSVMYNYFKFPGGGLEKGETNEDALIRETLEEAGLQVIPESIREYGLVHRVQKGKREDIFVQDNFYYLCDTKAEIVAQKLDDYEEREHFTLKYVSPQEAIKVNREMDHGPKDKIMVEREARVIETLLNEHYFEK